MDVVVASHTVAIDAHITKGLLESRDIPAYINDDQYITMNWTLSHALGGVKVSVPTSCYEAATEILAQEKAGELTIDHTTADEETLPDYIPEETIYCPQCNSDETAYFDWFRKIALLVLFTFSMPFAFSKRYSRCSTCSTLFPDEKGVISKACLAFWVILSTLLLLLTATRYLNPSNHSYDGAVLMYEADEIFDSGIDLTMTITK